VDKKLFDNIDFWHSFGEIFPDSVVMIKRDGNIVYKNRLFKELMVANIANLFDFVGKGCSSTLNDAMGSHEKGKAISLSTINFKSMNALMHFSCYLFPLENDMFSIILAKNTEMDNKLLLLENIVNTVPDPVIVKDVQHRWIYVNQAFADMLQCPPSQIIGKGDHDFFPPDECEVFHKLDRKTFKHNKTTINEEKFTCRIKGQRTVSTKKSIFRTLAGSQILVGIIRDVTEIKEARDFLKKQSKELKRQVDVRTKQLQTKKNELESFVEKLKGLNSDLDCFAHICCHELREPLRTISSFSKLVRDEYSRGEHKNIDEFLDIIHKGASKMDVLIKSILEYSTSGLNTNSMSLFSSDDLISEVLLMLDHHIKTRNATITFEDMPDIYADRLQILQLFQNLINNAIKFCAAPLTPVINIQVIQKNNFFEFSIKDNGIGIAKKYHNEIFLPFKKFHSRSEGSMYGIGLSLCKKIVENHGGAIKMSSQENLGTTFEFSLPTQQRN